MLGCVICIDQSKLSVGTCRGSLANEITISERADDLRLNLKRVLKMADADKNKELFLCCCCCCFCRMQPWFSQELKRIATNNNMHGQNFGCRHYDADRIVIIHSFQKWIITYDWTWSNLLCLLLLYNTSFLFKVFFKFITKHPYNYAKTITSKSKHYKPTAAATL